MQIDDDAIREALRKILNVEREHMFGAKTGSQTARKREVEREVDRELAKLQGVLRDSGSNRNQWGKK
jgi:hypothetical protein